MRIIIETDSNTQPRIEMGAQGTDTFEGLQSGTTGSGNAIDAGPPKVGGNNSSLQSTGNLSATESAAPQGDSGSAGSAPKELSQ